MSIRDDILQAMMEIDGYSRPKEIRLGINATKELISRMDARDFQPAFSVAERNRFQGVPFRQMSSLAMDPDSWEVRPDRCEICEGRGWMLNPIRPFGPEDVSEAICYDRGNPFKGPPCETCHGKPLEPIKGSIAVEEAA